MATDYRSTLLAAASAAAGGADSLGPEAAVAYQAHLHHPVVLGIPIVCNLLAVAIVAMITWLLVIGVKESARFNNVIVVLKVITLLFFIGVGAFFVKPANWHPFFPGGASGVWTGASLIFFAYIGFDAVSTAAEECRNPGRDMPRGIIGSLVICTVLYIGAALVLTGMIPFTKLHGVADPLAAALSYVQQDWAAGLLAFGAVVAMTAVLLVFQLGQPRILMAMSRDGLLGPWFAKIHPKYRTPARDHHSDRHLCGGLFRRSQHRRDRPAHQHRNAICVRAGVHRNPDPAEARAASRRKFRVPLVPLTPLLGIFMCLMLMAGLPLMTWIRFVLWLAAGLVIYFLYGMRRSRLR